MPSFISKLNGLIEASTLGPAHKQKVKALLHGVKRPDNNAIYIYSCPFPLLEKAGQSALVEAFADKLINAARGLSLTRPHSAEARSDEELFRELFILNDDIPKVIIYPGYASGDMYGFGAAMAINDTLQMVIMKDSENPGRIDRTNATQGFLEEVVGKVGRVRTGSAPMVFAKNPNPEKKPKGKELQYLTKLDEVLWTLFIEKGAIHCAVDLFFGTGYVAQCFVANPARKGEPRKSSRLAVRRKWLELDKPSPWNASGSAARTRISTFLNSRIHGVPVAQASALALPQKANIVVLWSRFTGKTGGAHVEYDTSLAGLKQLVSCAFAAGAEYVFVAGDTPKAPGDASESKKQKRREFLAKLREEIRDDAFPKYGNRSSPGKSPGTLPRLVVDLTEFWNDPEWPKCFGLLPGQKAKRIDQFKLFELLAEKNKVKHFGARSGNLESLALLGYTVCYFEDGTVDRSWENAWITHGFFDPEQNHTIQMEGTPPPVPGAPEAMDKQRMAPWHQTVGYKRIKIADVPTRSGKFLVQNGLGGQPSWTYDKRISGSLSNEDDVAAAYLSYYSSASAPFDLQPPDFASHQDKVSALAPSFKPDAVQGMSKGFSSSDLTEIANYLTFR